jgi:hypothetical protein
MLIAIRPFESLGSLSDSIVKEQNLGHSDFNFNNLEA